ncbi:hypothetical protein K437DRAFT_99839 [Tilletiaria anomala UBC 951]|uniref:C3H1-type domain-containing protein n=1 Tax=Tilletiaria anomala (strain ATCC 24038 / CBS 436.72 / UBC 951) TaxID=1037660 RepID=A0A066W9D2_TILAU|nr:uncharacterized protein K437DRAFT_99839 [Tilletiaria anomala UBC 951]KDN47345.1 hypothetical protein K437DRAFT_99839 [Tilletiaria anomala UBC 951]
MLVKVRMNPARTFCNEKVLTGNCPALRPCLYHHRPSFVASVPSATSNAALLFCCPRTEGGQ